MVADAWVDVASKLLRCEEHYSDRIELQGLAVRCFEKGRFSSDPKQYVESGIDIRLNELMDEVVSILKELGG